MAKISLLFEAGPMVDIKKTGVGYYTGHLIKSLAEHHGENLQLNGYYFDFLSRNHKQPPKLLHVRFYQVRFIPGKLLSLCRRLHFQPFLEIFVRQKADIVLFTNYVSLPSIQKHR